LNGTTSGCEVQLSNASSYQQPELIPGPLVVYTNIDLPDGPGIRNFYPGRQASSSKLDNE
tara:strand:- start:127 stop:306 length:180 start_codon:yes stop_codon:yes gene_type:complete